jgi:hypothetical protein
MLGDSSYSGAIALLCSRILTNRCFLLFAIDNTETLMEKEILKESYKKYDFFKDIFSNKILTNLFLFKNGF